MKRPQKPTAGNEQRQSPAIGQQQADGSGMNKGDSGNGAITFYDLSEDGKTLEEELNQNLSTEAPSGIKIADLDDSDVLGKSPDSADNDTPDEYLDSEDSDAADESLDVEDAPLSQRTAAKKNVDPKRFDFSVEATGEKKDSEADGNTPSPSQPSTGVSTKNEFLLLLLKIGLVAAFLLFMTTFLFGITQVRDTSMSPAVKEGDLVVYYRPQKNYVVNDAIVVDDKGKLQVRRVVAVAGDTVDISSDGGLIINGSTQIEDDIYTNTLPYKDGITFPVTVGEGEVFVLGDNRTTAEDSRIYGPVKISATKGRVMTVIRRRGI